MRIRDQHKSQKVEDGEGRNFWKCDGPAYKTARALSQHQILPDGFHRDKKVYGAPFQLWESVVKGAQRVTEKSDPLALLMALVFRGLQHGRGTGLIST